MALRTALLDSPLGPLRLTASDAGLVSIQLPGPGAEGAEDGPATPPDDPVLEAAARQLTAYFAGTRRTFDLPLAPYGTPFQNAVWEAVRAIPFGETRSYGEVARAIGRPGAVRAVGLANGRNPWPIVVPCHRVIGADGSLTGYAGGEALKRRLLDHEADGAPQGRLWPLGRT